MTLPPRSTYIHASKSVFDSDKRTKSPAFLAAVTLFVENLVGGGQFREGLRVKGVQGAAGVFELTWAPDGRATFGYGESVPREAHVIWRRVGTWESLDL
jgi:hypothetical protein